MDNGVLRITFYSADRGLAGLVRRTLGSGMVVCSRDQFFLERKDLDWQDAILLDLSDGGRGSTVGRGMQLMDEMKKSDPCTPIIVIVGYGDDDLARKAMAKGAFDTLASPPDIAELRWLLRRAHQSCQAERELSRLRRQACSGGCPGDVSGNVGTRRQLIGLARKISSCDVSILITGETGTGKNLLARRIHQLSSRRRGPFVGFCCATLPETLMEDDLFGHE